MRIKAIALFVLCSLSFSGCTAKEFQNESLIKPLVWAVSPTYTEAYSFSSGLAYVKTTNGEGYFINTEGEKALDIPHASISTKKSSNSPMAYGVAYTYNNSENVFLLSRSGTSIPSFPPSMYLLPHGSEDSLFLAKDTDKELFGYMNLQNLWYIEPAYIWATPFRDGISAATKENRDYLVDCSGGIVPFDAAGRLQSYADDIAVVKTHTNAYFADRTGVNIFGEQFDDAQPFSEGYAAVQLAGLWGYVDKECNWLIEPAFSEVFDFSEGLALVSNEKDQEAFINTEGSIVIPFQNAGYLSHYFASGLCIKRVGNSCGIVNTRDEWVITPEYETIVMYENYATLEKGSKKYVYCVNTNTVLGTSFLEISEVSSALLAANSGDVQYIVNLEDGTVSKNSFVRIVAFSEGLALAADSKTGLMGFTDANGVWVIQPEFQDCRPFSGGLAAVKLDGKWGYIANPQIYDEWIPDEIDRGISLRLFEQEIKSDEYITTDAATQLVQPLIAQLSGTNISSNDIAQLLSDSGIDITNTPELTKENAACILTMVAKMAGKQTDCLFAFLSDEDDVSADKLAMVSYSACFGLFDYDIPGVFNPQKVLTKQEFAAAIVRLFEVCL